MIIRRRSIHYKHSVTVYVPVFQKDFDKDGNLLGSPTFEHSFADATSDEQLAYSMNPDYVLVLNGEFDATTKPLEIQDE